MTADFHFAEQTFTLHLFLKSAQSLINVIVAYDDLYDGNHPFPNKSRTTVVFRPEGYDVPQHICENKKKLALSLFSSSQTQGAAPQHIDFPCYFEQKVHIIANKSRKLSCSAPCAALP